jgi:uncharacterized protein (DUF1684 family)
VTPQWVAVVAEGAVMTAPDALSLADWRRQIAEVYSDVRNSPTPVDAWAMWRERRELLFLHHPDSPLQADQRTLEHAPRYFPYDPALRAAATVENVPASQAQLPASASGEFAATRVGTAHFRIGDQDCALGLYWLRDYAGGLFVSFRDGTSGTETYGAGRYVLDTAKGADLGMAGEELILDFNFAYQPSCSYDPIWACPLAPAENRLTLPVRGGERL